MRTDRLYRATAVMTVGTALSRITGLVRVAALTYALGVTGTRLADTYNLANTTPNIVYELFLGGIFTAVFVPVLVEIRSSKDTDASPLVTVSLIGLGVVSAIAFVAAPAIMRIYFVFRDVPQEVTNAQLELATFLLRWFAPQILFDGLTAISQALLNVRDRFGPPMFAPVLNNLAVIATLLTFARAFSEQGLDLSTGAKVLLGAGTTAGVALQAIVLLPLLRGEGLRFAPRFTDPAVRRVVRRAGYVVGYVVLNQVGLWVVLALANRVSGGVTAYQVAFQFFQLPHGLFAVSLVTALQPDLARAATDRDLGRFRETFGSGIRGVAYLLLPAAVGYVILAEPVTRLLLARGAATDTDAALIAGVLQAFSVGLVFFSAFQFLTRGFYAFGDTRTPTVINAAAVTVNIAANVALFSVLGVRGLALAHAVAYLVGSVLLTRALSRRVGGLRLRTHVAPIGRIVGATAVMGLAVWWLTATLEIGDAGIVAVAVGAGTILYLVFSLVMGIPERRILLSVLRRTPRTGPTDDTQGGDRDARR